MPNTVNSNMVASERESQTLWLPKYDPCNFIKIKSQWRAAFLRKKKITMAIEAERPADLAEDAPQYYTNLEKQEDWDEGNKSLFSYLYESIDKSLKALNIIEDESYFPNGRKVWLKLIEINNDKSKSALINRLDDEFSHTRINPQETVESYLKRVETCPILTTRA